MRVAITGSTSHVGQHMVAKLSRSGHQVVPLGGSQSKLWKLGDVLPKNLKVDALLHLAHDRSLTLKENVESAVILTDSFAGPKIFLSSFSAHSKTISKYGKSKYEIEKVFKNNNGTSLRAGVIYGEKMGGIFQQLESLLVKIPLVPIPFKGDSLLFTTHIEDLSDEILLMLNQSTSSTTFAAHPMPISLYALCLELQASMGLKKKFIRLSNHPTKVILQVIRMFHLNIPMADSLFSLSTNVSLEELSELRIAKSNFRSFELNSLVICPN